MIKKKTLLRRKIRKANNFEGAERVDTRAYLLNQDNIGNAILECLINNDPEGVIEIISIYLRVLNKEKHR